MNLIRKAVLGLLDLAQDRQCLLDSLPIPVVGFHLAPQAGSAWSEHGATFGRISSKKITIFGYKLHFLLAVNGTILDFELAPANETDLNVGQKMLSAYTDLLAMGDKAYLSQAVQEACAARNVRLLTLPRSNQKQQVSQEAQARFNKLSRSLPTRKALPSCRAVG